MQFPSPRLIKHELPLRSPETITQFRNTAKNILTNTDKRLALILGPCSIHNLESAYEYAVKLQNLASEIDHTFFPVMRVFIEKPRTKHGWKGFVYDPFLDGTHAIEEGIRRSRRLLLQITELGIPCAVELLEPMLAAYFTDLITWGLIGARTSASQPHRQMASGLPFPVGFKNNLTGDIDIAVTGVAASQIPHAHVAINEEGQIASVQTDGNPMTHLVLRGSLNTTNYDQSHVHFAERLLKSHDLQERLLIDCSHGNCQKEYHLQALVFDEVFEQAMQNSTIRGLMLESNLFSGNQAHIPTELDYGVSITDPCLGWDETEQLLRSKSTCLTQK